MNVMGLYSGIDMSMVDQMIEAEKAKGVKFTQRKEQYTQSQNAWKDLNTRLDSLHKRLDDLQKPENFQSKTAKLTGPEHFSVSTETNALTGNYRVQVSQLATQSRLNGEQVKLGDNVIDSVDTTLGINGSISFKGETSTIEISDTDSLRDISRKINEKTSESGVKSSIIDNRLVLVNTEFGTESIGLTGSGDTLSRLGLNQEEIIGQEAKFSIDGLEVTRSSNTIDDAIEGLTFTLTNVHAGEESTVLAVSENLDKAADTLQKFVEQYNSTQSYITQQLSVGDPSAENNKTGTLSGDGTLMRLQSSLRSLMTASTGTGEIKSLADLGVTIDRSGTASFNRSALEEQLKDKPQAVSDFFSRTVTEQVEVEKDGIMTTESKSERKGFSVDMRSFVNEYISGTTGIIKGRQDTYDRMIKDLNKRIEQFDMRIDAKRERYIRQFSALDTAMMRAESQMNFMFSQLGMNSN